MLIFADKLDPRLRGDDRQGNGGDTFKSSFHSLKGLKTLLCLVAIVLCPVISGAEDFFPIGMFSVGPDSLEIVKEAGFNTAHTYISDPAILQKYIEKADKLGMKLLLFPGDRADQGNIDRMKVKKFVEENKGAKSILAWYLADEPELNNMNSVEVKAINSFVKKMDSSRHTAMVIHRTDKFGEYRDASDILMIDRYPVPKLPLNHVAEASRWAVNQKGDSGPVWTVLQAFGYQNPQLKGWGVPREPTYDEMRAMTFLSIIYGVKGIFYYTFTGSQYRIMHSPEHWNDLKKIVKELNSMYPLLLAGYNYEKVRVDIVEGPQRDDRGLLPVHIAEKHLMKDTGNFAAGKYYIVANSTGKKVRAKFSFTSLPQRNGMIDVIGEKRNIKFEGETFSDTFEPYAVHIFKLQEHP